MVMKKKLLILVKLCISVALFYWLFSKIPADQVLSSMKNANIYWLLAAVAAYSLSSFVSAWRWCHIAKNLGVELHYKRAVKLYYMGNFFNQILPSGIGGDAVKAVAIARGKDQKSASVHSVVLERLAGLGVLVAMLVFALPVIYEHFPPLAYIVALIGVGALFSLPVYFYLLKRPQILKKRKATAWIGRFFVDIEKAFVSFPKISFQLITSFTVQILSILTLYFCALSVGSDVEFVYMLCFAPLMFLLLVLPISLGGWGLREGIAVSLFAGAGVMQSSDALTMSLLVGFVVILASAPGGVFLSEFNKQK